MTTLARKLCLKSLVAALFLMLNMGLTAKAQSTNDVAGRTEVKLILLKKLQSYPETKEGTAVPMVVAEDVKVHGAVFIAKGALATGRVIYSRAMPAIGPPAMLHISIDKTSDIHGKEVKLTAANSPNLDPPYDDPCTPEQRGPLFEECPARMGGTNIHCWVFSRKNTSIPKPTDQQEMEYWKRPEMQKLLVKIADMFRNGRKPNFNNPDELAVFTELAQGLKLTATAQFIQDGGVGDVAELIQRLMKNQPVLGGNPIGLIDSVIELADVCKEFAPFFHGWFIGKNITASPGLELKAYITE